LHQELMSVILFLFISTVVYAFVSLANVTRELVLKINVDNGISVIKVVELVILIVVVSIDAIL
jgi:hypothetical protein